MPVSPSRIKYKDKQVKLLIRDFTDIKDSVVKSVEVPLTAQLAMIAAAEGAELLKELDKGLDKLLDSAKDTAAGMLAMKIIGDVDVKKLGDYGKLINNIMDGPKTFVDDLTRGIMKGAVGYVDKGVRELSSAVQTKLIKGAVNALIKDPALKNVTNGALRRVLPQRPTSLRAAKRMNTKGLRRKNLVDVIKSAVVPPLIDEGVRAVVGSTTALLTKSGVPPVFAKPLEGVRRQGFDTGRIAQTYGEHLLKETQRGAKQTAQNATNAVLREVRLEAQYANTLTTKLSAELRNARRIESRPTLSAIRALPPTRNVA